jgi:hypothetical protein
MVTDEECVDYARECVRLVGLTTDQEIRDLPFLRALDRARNMSAWARTRPAGMSAQRPLSGANVLQN